MRREEFYYPVETMGEDMPQLELEMRAVTAGPASHLWEIRDVGDWQEIGRADVVTAAVECTAGICSLRATVSDGCGDRSTRVGLQLRP